MATHVDKPRVFISSTIKEFKDLRQAMKFWLEENGFVVQLSEHNDFDHQPDDGAFEACFENIRGCTHYILLIGDEPGSLYSATEGITVTRQEYREACRSWDSQRSPKIVSLARRRTMDTLREAEARETLDASQKTVHGFVKEVRREDVTDAAVQHGHGYPERNWLDEFSTFRDIVDVLRSTVARNAPLEKAAVLENLRHELLRNLTMTMIRVHKTGSVMYRHLIIDEVRDAVSITREDFGSNMQLAYQQLKLLMMYLPTQADALIDDALTDAIRSTKLLEYDVDNDAFVASDLLNALYAIREQMSTYIKRYSRHQEDFRAVAETWFAIKDAKLDGQVPGNALIGLFALHDTEKNLTRLIVAVLRALYGQAEDLKPLLRPSSPVIDEGELIEGEKVTTGELDEAFRADSLFLRLGEDMSEERRRELENAEKNVAALFGEERFEEFRRRVAHAIVETGADTPDEVGAIVESVLAELSK